MHFNYVRGLAVNRTQKDGKVLLTRKENVNHAIEGP